MDFYKLDFIARMLMVLNSSVNFVVYCSVSTPFKVPSRQMTKRKVIRSCVCVWGGEGVRSFVGTGGQ